MKLRLPQILAALMAAVIGVQLIAPGTAFAHERRTVGKYTFVVGFITEPAIVGQPNGISLAISDTSTNEPVEGAEKTLKASIGFGGGQPKDFTLRARFGQKGAYTADIIPTKAGAYIFNFTGAINDQQVNEKFESGPGRFGDAQPAADFQFPAVEQSTSTIDVQKQLSDAQAKAADAAAAADQARAFGIGGIAVGVMGILAGGVALMNGRGKLPMPSGSQVESS